MDLQSNAFESGGDIPARYTCDGESISPPLSWRSVPPEAKCLVLIVDDPEAPGGIFSHWVLYDIPLDSDTLEENVAREGQLASGAVQGRNDFGEMGYGPPCPPLGAEHNYYFRLYAIDESCGLAPGMTRAQVLDRIHNYVLESTELVGRYRRQGSERAAVRRGTWEKESL